MDSENRQVKTKRFNLQTEEKEGHRTKGFQQVSRKNRNRANTGLTREKGEIAGGNRL